MRAFDLIGGAKVCRSAADAKEHRFLRSTDRITMNQDRLLHDAIQLAKEQLTQAQRHTEQAILLPGALGFEHISQHISALQNDAKLSPHQVFVLETLAQVLCGGDSKTPRATSGDEIRRLEVTHVMRLFRTEETQQRIKGRYAK